MKSNPKQKAVYLALCILAAIVVWIFVDNFGNNGGAVMHTKWFRDVPITYTGETVLTERGFMLLDEDTVSTVDLEMEGTAFDLALLDKDYIRVTVDLSNVSRTGVQTVTSVIYGYTEEYFRQKYYGERPDALRHHHQRGGAVPQDGGCPVRDLRQCGRGLLRRRAAGQPHGDRGPGRSGGCGCRQLCQGDPGSGRGRHLHGHGRAAHPVL